MNIWENYVLNIGGIPIWATLAEEGIKSETSL